SVRPLHQRGVDGALAHRLRAARHRAAIRAGAEARPHVIRKTPITGDSVIFAPHRDERPNVYEGAPCPFCPGAESATPPEIGRDGDPWRVRVFPNKFPATAQHEVIVETARHGERFDELPA